MTVRKVLFVHHGSGKGGAAVSLLQLIACLDSRRYQPIVAVDFRRPCADEYFSGNGFRVIDCPLDTFTHTMKTWNWFTPRGIWKLAHWALIGRRRTAAAIRRMVTEVRPDLIHLNGLSVLPFAPEASACGVPVVQHVRESVNDGVFGIRKRWLMRLASKYVSSVIYICEDNALRLRGIQCPGNIIYNPVDIERYEGLDRERCREELGIPSDAMVLFFPGGSFFDIKGVRPFLQALARIRAGHPEAVALVPALDQTEASLIRALAIENAVLRVPFTRQVERYYAASDIVVAPFIVPHFSRAVIEAGAARRAVVGSRIGGITEVVEDGVTGLLATPGDSAELAACLERLIARPDERRALAEAGYLRARERYAAVAHAGEVMAVYDQVVGQCR